MIKILSDEAINKIREKFGYAQVIFPLDKAIAQEATRYAVEQMVEWGDEDCTEKEHYEFHVKKRECPICWQELKQQSEGVK